jgi:hypothetical protein
MVADVQLIGLILMPLSLDPNETVPVSLETDLPKPEEVRPVFLARHMTCAETRRVKQLTQQAFDEQDDDKSQLMVDRVLAIQYAGWRNVCDRDGKPIPFEAKDGRLVTADDALGAIDKWELVRAAVPATQMSQLEKKSALSRSRLEQARSAANAAMSESATSPPASQIASAPPV